MAGIPVLERYWLQPEALAVLPDRLSGAAAGRQLLPTPRLWHPAQVGRALVVQAIAQSSAGVQEEMEETTMLPALAFLGEVQFEALALAALVHISRLEQLWREVPAAHLVAMPAAVAALAWSALLGLLGRLEISSFAALAAAVVGPA